MSVSRLVSPWAAPTMWAISAGRLGWTTSPTSLSGRRPSGRAPGHVRGADDGGRQRAPEAPVVELVEPETSGVGGRTDGEGLVGQHQHPRLPGVLAVVEVLAHQDPTEAASHGRRDL